MMMSCAGGSGCSGLTGDFSWFAAAPDELAPRFSSAGAEGSAIGGLGSRCASVASPSGSSVVAAPKVPAAGGLGSLGSARTGEVCAEGALSSEASAWAVGVSVFVGTSRAGLGRR